MALSVIGAGFGRTGTLSLKGALELLGFDPCYHMMEVMQHGFGGKWHDIAHGAAPDWEDVFQGYKATVDWPACNYYRELAELYPDAKVILSLRDADKWYDSCQATIFRAMKMPREGAPPNVQVQMEMARKLVIENTFGGDIDDRAHAIAVYNRHNETVRKVIPADRLLVFQASDGWEPLCRFLGVPVPAAPYPKVNTTEEFQQHFPPPR
ncbi:sulfotransferase family protein [Iodidimonas sp. SYSU 1G8]|uniref:sulfotransferase family protein n=1 Tax=Iodidimonas sp. SYSU 1G8 TaxID=3133967 RepID=UPI0031FE8553